MPQNCAVTIWRVWRRLMRLPLGLRALTWMVSLLHPLERVALKRRRRTLKSFASLCYRSGTWNPPQEGSHKERSHLYSHPRSHQAMTRPWKGPIYRHLSKRILSIPLSSMKSDHAPRAGSPHLRRNGLRRESDVVVFRRVISWPWSQSAQSTRRTANKGIWLGFGNSSRSLCWPRLART